MHSDFSDHVAIGQLPRPFSPAAKLISNIRHLLLVVCLTLATTALSADSLQKQSSRAMARCAGFGRAPRRIVGDLCQVFPGDVGAQREHVAGQRGLDRQAVLGRVVVVETAGPRDRWAGRSQRRCRRR